MDWGSPPTTLRDDDEGDRFLTVSARAFARERSFGTLPSLGNINSESPEFTPLVLNPVISEKYVRPRMWYCPLLPLVAVAFGRQHSSSSSSIVVLICVRHYVATTTCYRQRFRSYLKALVPPIIIFLALLTLGTLVFKYGEDWEWRDALYVVVQALERSLCYRTKWLTRALLISLSLRQALLHHDLDDSGCVSLPNSCSISLT